MEQASMFACIVQERKNMISQKESSSRIREKCQPIQRIVYNACLLSRMKKKKDSLMGIPSAFITPLAHLTDKAHISTLRFLVV